MEINEINKICDYYILPIVSIILIVKFWKNIHPIIIIWIFGLTLNNFLNRWIIMSNIKKNERKN